MTKSTRPSSGTGSSRTVLTSNSKESRPMMKAGGFDSQIFTLIVGPEDEEKTFTAHASYLSQSPVFDRMCNGHFEEAHTFKIRLPEDTPKVIEALIEYLYSGNCRNYGTMLSGEDAKTATHQLAELYCVAEKNGLGDLKILVVNRLAAVTDVKNKAAEFLSVASIIYARTSESDEVYRTFSKIWLLSWKCQHQ